MYTAFVTALTVLTLALSGNAFAGKSSGSHASASSHTSSSSRPAVHTVTVSKRQHPESAKHIQDAQRAGHPRTLTVDRAGAKSNRAASLKGTRPQPNKDRDEYPPAMFKEGGKGASVRHIDPSDNRGAGSCIGAQCRGAQNGDKVRIKVVK